MRALLRLAVAAVFMGGASSQAARHGTLWQTPNPRERLLTVQDFQSAAHSPHLLVTFDGRTPSWNVSWDEVRKYVSDSELQALWTEAAITDSLQITFDMYADLYRVLPGPARLPGPTRLDACAAHTGPVSVDFKRAISASTLAGRYNGDVGVPGHQLAEQLFFHATNLFRLDNERHKVFFSYRANVVVSMLSFADSDYQLSGAITENFMFLVVFEDSGEQPRAMTLLLGRTGMFPSMRGSVTASSLTVALNDEESLLVVTSREDFEYFEAHSPRNWTSLFLTVTNASVQEAAVRLQAAIVDMAARGLCGSSAHRRELLETYFALLALYYKIGLELGARANNNVALSCIANKLYAARVSFDMLARCYPAQTSRGFTSTGVARTAAASLAAMPFSGTGLPPVPRDWLLQAVYFAESSPQVDERSLAWIVRILADVYSRYTVGFSLTEGDRKDLFQVYAAVRHRNFTAGPELARYVSLAYCYTTSMCSSVEVARAIEDLGKARDRGPHSSFSPCFMSLRYDYTLEKLRIEGLQDVDLTQGEVVSGISAMYSLLKNNPASWATGALPARDCITAPGKVKMIVPLGNTTFVISSGVAARGHTYDVAETFLKSSMVITAVSNEHCRSAPVATVTLRIPVLYNMTRPRGHCQLCQSAVVSYDEYDGIETLAYISSHAVQGRLFAEGSLLFDFQNMHTHYLLLMNNGTVVEIRGLYRNRALTAVITIMFIVAAVAGAFVAYKIVMALSLH